MAKSKALERFNQTWDRAFWMVERHYEIFKAFVESETKEDWDKTHDDLFRAAIIMAVTAMDAYFTDRFCEALIPYLKKHKINKYLTERLLAAGFDTETALEMFQMDRPNRRLSNMMRRHLESFVTQNFKVVDDLFKAYGFDKFTFHAQGLARRKNLLNSVQLLVTRRHQIVHRGDYNAHGKLQKIDYKKTVFRMGDLTLLIEKCDELLSKKGV